MPEEIRKKSSLNSHLKTHVGEKSHECPFCKVKFSLKSHMDVHVLDYHSVIINNFQPENQVFHPDPCF